MFGGGVPSPRTDSAPIMQLLQSRRARAGAAILGGVLVATCFVPAPSGHADSARSEAPPDVGPPHDFAVMRLDGVDLEALGLPGPLPAVDLAAAGAPIAGDGMAVIDARFARLRSLRWALGRYRHTESALASEVARLAGRLTVLQEETVSVARRHDRHRVRARRARVLEQRARDRLERHRSTLAELAVSAYVAEIDQQALGAVLDGSATATDHLSGEAMMEAALDRSVVRQDRLERDLAAAAGQRDRRDADEWFVANRHKESARRLERVTRRHRHHARALSYVRGTLEAIGFHVHGHDVALAEATRAHAAGILGQVGVRTPVGKERITRVRDLAVHEAIAPALTALIERAEAEGVILRGWGHRSHQRQIELRAAHCGATPHDIYEKPSHECSPPTARPGMSMHEFGLAVDFTHDGAAIDDHGSVAFRWLAFHAPAFGLYNLPSEPWHWSVNAQ